MSNRDSSTETRSASASSNSSAEAAYNNGQGCSLLFHPLGVLLLEYYYSLVYDRTPTPDWFKTLQDKVQKPLTEFQERNQTENDLTEALHGVFQRWLPTGVYRERRHSGKCYDWEAGLAHPTSGRLGVAFCKSFKQTLEAETKQDPDDYNAEDVVGILEVSVDGNGGVKKLSQALKYAALVCGGKAKPSANSTDEVSPDDIRSEKCAPPDSIDDTKPGPSNTPANQYVIVWTLHVHRSKHQQTSKKSAEKSAEGSRQQEGSQDKGGWIQHMKILVYLCEVSWNTKCDCPAAKYALLWREFADFPRPSGGGRVADDEQWTNALKKGSLSIARAVAMVFKLTDFIENKTVENKFQLWELKGPNCVKVGFASEAGKCFMLKVFDNRFAPTARSPFLWCVEEVDYDLRVEPYLLFHEGCTVGGGATDTASTNAASPLFAYFRSQERSEDLSKRVKQRIHDLSEGGHEDNPSNVLLGNPMYQRSVKTAVPYGDGTVVVLQYDYVEGSHWPECIQKGTDNESSINTATTTATITSTTLGSPRSFEPILKRLESLHELGLVHGDVRLFNMIFAKWMPGDTREKAWLLDFDLGGKAGERRYPKGYQKSLDDVGKRAGRPDYSLLCWHDLADFVGVLRLFVLNSALLENLDSMLRKYDVKLRELEEKQSAWGEKNSELAEKSSELAEKSSELAELYKKLFDSGDQQQSTKEANRIDSEKGMLESKQREISSTIGELKGEVSKLEDDMNSLLGDESIQLIWKSPTGRGIGTDRRSRASYLRERKGDLERLLQQWRDKLPQAAKNPNRDEISRLLRVDEEVKMLFRNDKSDGDDVDPGLYFTPSEKLMEIMDKLQGKESKREPQDSATKKDLEMEATGSPDRSHVANLGSTGGSQRKSARSKHTPVGSGSTGQVLLETIAEDAKRDYDDDEVVPT